MRANYCFIILDRDFKVKGSLGILMHSLRFCLRDFKQWCIVEIRSFSTKGEENYMDGKKAWKKTGFGILFVAACFVARRKKNEQ